METRVQECVGQWKKVTQWYMYQLPDICGMFLHVHTKIILRSIDVRTQHCCIYSPAKSSNSINTTMRTWNVVVQRLLHGLVNSNVVIVNHFPSKFANFHYIVVTDVLPLSHSNWLYLEFWIHCFAHQARIISAWHTEIGRKLDFQKLKIMKKKKMNLIIITRSYSRLFFYWMASQKWNAYKRKSLWLAVLFDINWLKRKKTSWIISRGTFLKHITLSIFHGIGKTIISWNEAYFSLKKKTRRILQTECLTKAFHQDNVKWKKKISVWIKGDSLYILK